MNRNTLFGQCSSPLFDCASAIATATVTVQVIAKTFADRFIQIDFGLVHAHDIPTTYAFALFSFGKNKHPIHAHTTDQAIFK